MTKRSLKGTEITTLTGWTRDAKRSIWLADTTPDSSKDNPIAETLIQDRIIDDIFRILDGGFIDYTDSTNDAIAFDTSSAITNAGSVYTVNRVFYLLVNRNLFKVNTGSDTEVTKIRLEVSSTEDGMLQTLDIADGTSVAAYEGNTLGDGVVNVDDILWMGDVFSIDLTNNRLQVDNITDAAGTGAVGFPQGIQVDEITDAAGTGAVDFPNGLTSKSINETMFSDRFSFTMLENTTAIKLELTPTFPTTGNLIHGTIELASVNQGTGGRSIIKYSFVIERHFDTSYDGYVVTLVNSRDGTGVASSSSSINTSTGKISFTFNAGNNGTSTTTKVTGYVIYSKSDSNSSLAITTL